MTEGCIKRSKYTALCDCYLCSKNQIGQKSVYSFFTPLESIRIRGEERRKFGCGSVAQGFIA